MVSLERATPEQTKVVFMPLLEPYFVRDYNSMANSAKRASSNKQFSDSLSYSSMSPVLGTASIIHSTLLEQFKKFMHWPDTALLHLWQCSWKPKLDSIWGGGSFRMCFFFLTLMESLTRRLAQGLSLQVVAGTSR